MPIRTSSAHWQGSLLDGSGTMALGSGAFQGAYSYPTRFETAAGGTNPEELIAAAHAGCYSMALAHGLAQSGHPPTSIDTTAAVHLGRDGEGFAITRIDLTTRGVVPGLDEAAFLEQAQAAKVACPVSRALAAVTITLDAALAS
ncbi:MAG: OsmC family protein [Micromonosporaceae bacterium]|nr:OsmC family protein [Micromonosporaceae bacterium]